jgi:hypothetical protein
VFFQLIYFSFLKLKIKIKIKKLDKNKKFKNFDIVYVFSSYFIMWYSYFKFYLPMLLGHQEIKLIKKKKIFTMKLKKKIGWKKRKGDGVISLWKWISRKKIFFFFLYLLIHHVCFCWPWPGKLSLTWDAWFIDGNQCPEKLPNLQLRTLTIFILHSVCFLSDS